MKPTSLKTAIVGITQAGEYVVTLTVTDADGDSNHDSLKITVKEGKICLYFQPCYKILHN